MSSPGEQDVERSVLDDLRQYFDAGEDDILFRRDDYDRLQAEVAALKERLEASERDAARYAWIRDRQIEERPITYYSITHKLQFLRGVYGPVQFDAAIDTAMALARGGA